MTDKIKQYKLSHTASDIDAKLSKIDSLAEKSELPIVPTALPNPKALTFTGAVTGSYDGTTAKTVNIPAASVSSVNGETGDVTISVPTKTSDLTNDSGFIDSNHTHDYLPLAGGTISGDLNIDKSLWANNTTTYAVELIESGSDGGIYLNAYNVKGEHVLEILDSVNDDKVKVDGIYIDKSQVTDFPTHMPNPNALTINGVTYDGSSAVNINIDNTENATDEETVNSLIDTKMRSVKVYGAVGDGVTDDTLAFQDALANERVVFVPGGTYVLSDTLVIRPNCRLETSQDTILDFVNDSGNCIEMRSSATLDCNYGNIRVPYEFTGHVIDAVTTYDETKDTPPHTHWNPQWKRARYIHNVCIIKPDTNGLCYRRAGDGEECTGTGVYLSCDGNSGVRFMWGVLVSGLRVSGAFTHGVQVINYDLAGVEDSAWNHDMRIEAVIEHCETGVSLTNCNDVHLAVTVQPHCAQDEKTPYAKWGVYLNDCRAVDMSSSVIWDWDSEKTLYTSGGEYTAVAMYGNCSGLVYYDFCYHGNSTATRNRIYTDTPSNLEKMTIIQEPITKWFKPVEGEPYFDNGSTTKPLMLREEINEYFDTARVKGYTDVLSTAIDTDGEVYNEIGYLIGYNLDANENSAYYVSTGFIACKAGDVIRTQNISFDVSLTPTNTEAGVLDASCGIRYYDASFNQILVQNNKVMANNGGSGYYQQYERTEDGLKISLKTTLAEVGTVAYVRFKFHTYDFGEYPMMSINEEIEYTTVGTLSDGIKVKAENVIGGSTLTEDDVNALIDAKLEVIENGSY